MSKYITIEEDDYNELVKLAGETRRNTLRIQLYQSLCYSRNSYELILRDGHYEVSGELDEQFKQCLDELNQIFKSNDKNVKLLNDAIEKISLEKQRCHDIDHNVYKQVYKIPYLIRKIFGIKYNTTEFVKSELRLKTI